MSDYTDEPDERLTVVEYGRNGTGLVPLFAVETKDHGLKAAMELSERHGGKVRWKTVPLHRVTSYNDVNDLIPEARND